MEFTVRVYWGDQLLDADRLSQLVIHSSVIDALVSRAAQGSTERSQASGTYF